MPRHAKPKLALGDCGMANYRTSSAMSYLKFAGSGAEESWESYYQAAQQAYDGHNLLEARRLFMNALKHARQAKQDAKLTGRLESLADFYVQTDRRSQAEPLYKLLKKLRTKQS